MFGSGLGGQQGIEVSRWLVSVLGRVGAGLLLLLSIILYAIYVNRNTISLLNRVGKEIVDNGKKVGGAVTSTATDMIRHELRGGNKKVAASAATEPAEGLAENAATEPRPAARMTTYSPCAMRRSGTTRRSIRAS